MVRRVRCHLLRLILAERAAGGHSYDFFADSEGVVDFEQLDAEEKEGHSESGKERYRKSVEA